MADKQLGGLARIRARYATTGFILTWQIRHWTKREYFETNDADTDRDADASPADSVAPKVYVSPASVHFFFFISGVAIRKWTPLLKKTRSRQYRAGPAECLRKHPGVFGILRKSRDVRTYGTQVVAPLINCNSSDSADDQRRLQQTRYDHD